MVVSVLLKIKFGHAQISVPKIGIPMSKTACINPFLCTFNLLPVSAGGGRVRDTAFGLNVSNEIWLECLTKLFGENQ